MKKEYKFFNCFEQHEIEFLASKFQAPKEELIPVIQKLCKEGKIKYSTHSDAELELMKLGFRMKRK